MITTSMLKRQVWMADDGEFDHILENSERVLGLNAQYENHPYTEQFTKERSVMLVHGTYLLEGKVDAKFYLGDIWNLFQGDTLPDNAINFCRQMINSMKAWNYQQKTLDLPLNIKIIKQTHKIMMDGEKDVLVGKYRSSSVYAGYHIFAPASHVERSMEDGIFSFYETNKDDPIIAATNLFGNIINIHSFEDGNGKICRLILAHVLIQMKCFLFRVILSSFYRRGRRHYIRAVKIFDRKPSMLNTMIVKSLIHCWDNFEQNARMMLNFQHTHLLVDTSP